MAIMFDIGIPEPILYYKLLQLAKYDDVYIYMMRIVRRFIFKGFKMLRIGKFWEYFVNKVSWMSK